MSSDAEFLGLAPDGGDGRFRFTVASHLARLDARLYGGTAIAVSITSAEEVSQRPALWMTTQFVSTAPAEAEILVHAEVLAPGKRTNQVRVTGTTADGAVMFASLGATGHHRDGGLTGVFENPPKVTGPEDAGSWATPFTGMLRNAGIDVEMPPMPADKGFSSVIEFREPTIIEHPDPGAGRVCLWVRRRDRQPVTPAMVAFMADMVPLSVAHACGVVAGGISLDNSIRIGSFEPSEWVLVDLRPHLAVGDYGHGAAHIWSESGHLLATASQTASMLRFDLDNAPWNRRTASPN
jgi:acyl-CoA thioesterase II